MTKKTYFYAGIAALLIILFGLMIYPTMYKYDKLDQRFPVRINRITGDTEVLRSNGWVDVDATQSEIDKVRYEVNADFEALKSKITQEVKDSIRNEVVSSLQKEIKATKAELESYKKFETDPNNYFSIGSTKEEVKNIMGAPTGTYVAEFSGYETWNYGYSTIKFIKGKVSEYHNNDKNLRIK